MKEEIIIVTGNAKITVNGTDEEIKRDMAKIIVLAAEFCKMSAIDYERIEKDLMGFKKEVADKL